jgi:hypothetical protein
MKIIAHTPRGTFEGVNKEYNEEDYFSVLNLLSQIDNLPCLTFETDTGDVCFPKEMLQQSVFVIEK